jgi:hypothetical protein
MSLVADNTDYFYYNYHKGYLIPVAAANEQGLAMSTLPISLPYLTISGLVCCFFTARKDPRHGFDRGALLQILQILHSPIRITCKSLSLIPPRGYGNCPRLFLVG